MTDAWYIDLNRRLSCDRNWPAGRQARGHLALVKDTQPIEKPEFVTIGEPEIGFALDSRVTSKGMYTLPDGTRKQTDSNSETLVTQLEEGSLDPALFEIPPGVRAFRLREDVATKTCVRSNQYFTATM